MTTTREERQQLVFDWGCEAFTKEQMTSFSQRGIRFLEEAIELAQAVGVGKDMAHQLLDYIYARPVGGIYQELGGVGVTLLALAHCAGVSADDAERDEVTRVLAKPIDHFKARNKVKNDAGFFAVGAGR